MKYEELQEFYKDFTICNGQEYWEYLILEYILNNHTEEQINNMKLTEEKLEGLVFDLMSEDSMWNEIDWTIFNIISRELGD